MLHVAIAEVLHDVVLEVPPPYRHAPVSRDAHMDQDDEALAEAIALSLQPAQDDEPASTNSRTHGQQRPQRAEEASATSLDREELPPSHLSDLHAEDGWAPNTDQLQVVMSMGISENAATRALYHTGNRSAEAALAWVCENLKDPELHQPFVPPPASLSPTQASRRGRVLFQSLDDVFSETSYKMVFVVNTELKMGCGKMAAQVGHAAVGLYAILVSGADLRDQVASWEECGSKKVVLKGGNASHLAGLAEKAESVRIPTIVIRDAGRTQVEPGSLTVLALFGKAADVDAVTGHLKLM